MEKEPNMLLSIALVLDPRFKLKYLKFCYNKIYELSVLKSISVVNNVEKELWRIFGEYSALYESSCSQEKVLEKEKQLEDEVSTSNFSFKNNLDFMEEFY